VIQARQEDLPMSDQFWLTKAQLKRLGPFFPRTRGVPRVDDRRVVSGIVHVIRNGLRWRDAPAVYGPHKTLYNRFVRWSRMGIAANGAFGREAWLSFSTFSFNDGEFHLISPQWPIHVQSTVRS
jgi:hypothetical protein